MNTVSKMLIVGAMLTLSAPAFSQSCEELSASYNFQEKMHFKYAEGPVGSDSAVLFTNSKLDQLMTIQNRQMLLQFMDKQNCPYPDINNYAIQAYECHNALLDKELTELVTRSRSSEQPAICDISKW